MGASFIDNASTLVEIKQDDNLVDYTVIKKYYSTAPYRGFGVKYVADGTELYSANGKKYFVNAGEYLLSNNFCEGYVEVDSAKPVGGICIDISPAIISEVAAGFIRPDTADYDLELDSFFNTPRFLENKYSAKQTSLGKLLGETEYILKNCPKENLYFGNDFYFSVAEKVVEDHIPLVKQLQQVKAIKHDTRKDLLRKLLVGKEYMQYGFYSSLTVKEVAVYCGLSEYHFFRLFKSVFGVSPHQFLIEQRLQASVDLLTHDKQSISSVAVKLGFSDVYAFSKAFKKKFGYPPSRLY